MKIRLPRIKLPRLQIQQDVIVKTAFILVYSVACLFILIPQIDYQSWYPEKLGTYDYKLGIEYREHKRISIDLKENNIDDKQVNALVEAIYQRAEEANLNDFFIRKNSDKLEIHIPHWYSDSFATSLISPGKIEILKPKDLESEDSQPSVDQIFSRDNYESVGIKTSKFDKATITNQRAGYSYISIKSDKDQERRLNKLGEESQTSNIGLVIDDSVNLAWVLPSDDETTKYPTLIILMESPEVEIFVSQLINDPLEMPIVTSNIDTVKGTQRESTLYAVIGSIVGLTAAGLLFQALYRKYSVNHIAATGLMIIGIMTLLKITEPTLSLAAMIGTLSIFVLIMFLKSGTYAIAFPIIIVIGLASWLSPNPTLKSIANIYISTGIFATSYYIVCYLLGIYEEKS
ncbi:hypothetical protein JW710_02945 [Candidatus Dojkabacteria bacterium]|nr:hypothetical protein [Candidatus Dojkabacteria bacterium]